MSLPPPKSEPDDDSASLSSVEQPDGEEQHLQTIPLTKPTWSAGNKPSEGSNGFLSAPLSGPLRPMSPDTLSNLSIDEYEQIPPNRSTQHIPGTSHLSLDTPQTWKTKLFAFWTYNKGLVYMVIAQFFGTLMNVTTRLLEIEGNDGDGLHPFQILFARMSITVALASGYMWYNKTPYFPLGKPGVRLLLMARGFGGFFGVFGMYYSLLYLPLADATVITFLAPGLACWACALLIKEPFTRVEQIGGLVSLIGVVLIARPTTLFQGGGDAPTASGNGDGSISGGNSTTTAAPGSDASSYGDVTSTQRLSAVGIALLGVLGSATAFTTIRWIGKRAHPLISVNYFAAWCTLVSIVMQFALPGVGFFLPNNIKDWAYLIFLGVCGFTMQFLLATALAHEKSSRATNMTYTQMLFALGFDKLIFDHTPGLLSILGSSLILGSAIVVAVQRESPSTNKNSSQGSRMAVTGDNLETGEDHELLPVREVHMRTLR